MQSFTVHITIRPDDVEDDEFETEMHVYTESCLSIACAILAPLDKLSQRRDPTPNPEQK